jgi:hypothetical protein
MFNVCVCNRRFGESPIYTEIYKTNLTYSIIDLSPDNVFDESGLLEIVRNGQTHVLATNSPSKGRI